MAVVSKTITLSVNSDHGAAGKQFVGRVIGPSDKFGLNLDFGGVVSGKRRDTTTLVVARAGLYKCRDVTRRGPSDTHVLIWPLDDGLVATEIHEDEAVALAQDMTTQAIEQCGRRNEALHQLDLISSSEALDMDGESVIGDQAAEELGLAVRKLPRRELCAARRRYVERLRGGAPATPTELSAPTAPVDPVHARRLLLAERIMVVARLAEVDDAISALDAALVADPVKPGPPDPSRPDRP